MVLTGALLLAPTGVLVAYYLRRTLRQERESLAIREAAAQAGLTEPPSLHPLIEENRCLGCGSCVDACPEHHVLGLIDGRAHLIEPTRCIGHGACRTACPAGAISLVFGTEKRGVDIPLVSPEFETNVPGIFIAGELGGMGLIRNAVTQGRQAIESIRRRRRAPGDPELDVVIVGAGPAGFAASLAAMEHRLRFVTVEQETLGGTVAHYPRGKLVMTEPAVLPLAGRMPFTETTKEELLAYWRDVEKRTGVPIRYGERMEEIERNGRGYHVRTTGGSYHARNVLLAIGRRGTPRKLGVPGEELPKVMYRLIEPEQFRDHHVLVVGGGDSALEAAASLAEERTRSVTLAYRGEAFQRARAKNRQRVKERTEEGRLRVLLRSNVEGIAPDRVRIRSPENPMEVPNDAVIVCAGGILPTPLLKRIGITVETKHGTA